MQVTERREIRLQEWEEIVGTFRGIVKEEFRLSILIDNSCMVFNDESTEAQIVEEKLNRTKSGEKIAILRTDIPEKPLVIRKDEWRAGHQKLDS
jgi:hypothetical protein